MGLSLMRERAHDLTAEIAPLLREHFEEIAHYQDIPLKPDIAAYCTLEDAGALRCFTARIDGELIGYALFFVKHHPHYMTSLQAHEDILFVDPKHRKTRAGLSLIRYADQQLALEGVQVVYHHMKAAHSFAPLLERMGYELVDLIYAKRLDKAAAPVIAALETAEA